MSKSQTKRTEFSRESLDLITSDVEQFRETVARYAAELPRALRIHLEAIDANSSLLNDFYDTLLPTLRRMHTRSGKKSLRATLTDTYELTEDESALVTDVFRDHRAHRLMTNYLDCKKAAKDTRRHLLAVFDKKTAPEQAALIEQYFAYRTYAATAQRGLVTYVDSQTSRRTQRKARRQIAREQRTYGESFKQHRENVAYRLAQLTKIYDELLEEIVASDIKPELLLAVATAYDRRARAIKKQSAKLALLTRLVAPHIERTIDATADQHAAISRSAQALHVASRVQSLSDTQRAHLVAAVDEYRSLALDYARIQSKHSSTKAEKLLAI